MKRIIQTLLVIAGVWLALVMLMFLFQNRLIFYPDKILPYDPSAYNLSWEEAWFETDDGKTLHGWYLPHHESDQILLFSHGNAGNIAYRLGLLEMMHRNGLSVFIYDYRGFGQSEGRPNERGVYRDVRAAWNYLTEGLEYRPDQIVLYGRSLGGPVSAHLAADVEPSGLIIESTFTSLKDLVSDIYPFVPTLLVRQQFDTIDYLSKTMVPVLILHSRDDRLIGIHHGKRLYEEANRPRRFVELRGGHDEVFRISGDLYFRELTGFLEKLRDR